MKESPKVVFLQIIFAVVAVFFFPRTAQEDCVLFHLRKKKKNECRGQKTSALNTTHTMTKQKQTMTKAHQDLRGWGQLPIKELFELGYNGSLFVQTVHVDTLSGATTVLYTFTIDRGVSFEVSYILKPLFVFLQKLVLHESQSYFSLILHWF